jgi:hypothetical protein
MIITKLAPAKFLSAELTALQINVASVSKIIKLITHKKELIITVDATKNQCATKSVCLPVKHSSS